jgi:hypothetical protein
MENRLAAINNEGTCRLLRIVYTGSRRLRVYSLYASFKHDLVAYSLCIYIRFVCVERTNYEYCVLNIVKSIAAIKLPFVIK